MVPPPQFQNTRRGFTLIETLVSLAIFVVLMTLIFGVMQDVTRIWRTSNSTIESFQDARNAFQLLTRNLSQATLNTYYDYYDASGKTLKDTNDPTGFVPRNYGRQSELAFRIAPSGDLAIPHSPPFGQAIFFQAPVGRTTQPAKYGGLSDLLNACGYFVQYNSAASAMNIPPHTQPPAGSNQRYRYRLMQMIVSAEGNEIYDSTGPGWFANHLTDAQVASENILALILLAQYPDPSLAVGDSLSFDYDSSANVGLQPQPPEANQLPPVVQVTMVAIDETSAKRIATSGSTQPAEITAAFQGKFEDASKYQQDIEGLKTALNNVSPPIRYHIFSTAVGIRSSKWSAQ